MTSLDRARKLAKGKARKSAFVSSGSVSGISTVKRPLFRADTSLEALIENVQTLTGQRGANGAAVVMVGDNDSAVPFYPDGNGGDTGGTGTGAGGDGSGGNTVSPEYPLQPSGVDIYAGFSVVTLDWDIPGYYGHSLTEIWRCPEDNLTDAVRVGTTAANIYSDPIDPVFEGYYWIRFVNSDGVAGPYNDAAGLYVKTQESTDDILNVINDVINNSPLINELQSGLDGVTESVTTINNEGSQAFQNMWSVKASADGITAGIGLVAGTDDAGALVSQVAVAASQFFVFDPNNPEPDGTMTPIFYVDAERGVCMEKAVIEQATIEVLNAQEIVADHVVAGIEIESPSIKGGEIEIGSNFHVDGSGNLTGNNATLNDVTLNRLTANEGQLNNVVIAENCEIEGTLSVNQIKGDIVNAVGFDGYASGTRRVTITDDQAFDRQVIIPAIIISATGGHVAGGGDNPGYDTYSYISISVYWNGGVVASGNVSHTGTGTSTNSVTLVKDLLSGGGDVVIEITTSSSGSYTPHTACSDICLMVSKKGSGGIIVS